jgi:hypothetical protein
MSSTNLVVYEPHVSMLALATMTSHTCSQPSRTWRYLQYLSLLHVLLPST